VTETVDGDDSRTIVDPANVGIILENEPVRLEGVVRSDDPSEFQKPLDLEKGWAKNLASRFQQQQQDQSDGKRSFKLDVEIGAEPEVRQSTDASSNDSARHVFT
jgi:PAB1-binding protein PBP1